MKDESANGSGPPPPSPGCGGAGSVSSPTPAAASATSAPSLPAAVDRATFEAELGRLRAREKAHTREGDAIAAAEQCEGCTWNNTQVAELSYLHSRDITYAVFCQGPYHESIRYHDFMDWDMPWYSAHACLDALLGERNIGTMHLVCYLRDGDRVFETYWTTRRGVEAVDYSYALMDLTVYGRQEPWEDSPPGWPQQCTYTRTS